MSPSRPLRSAREGQIPGVRVVENALPESLFERLHAAVIALGSERKKDYYSTTFWSPRDATPTNLVEECVAAVLPLVDPGPQCVGIEWWIGRLRPGQKLRMHFDRDLSLYKEAGRLVHPIFGSALFLNAFASSPLILVEQRSSPDGKRRVPPNALLKQTVEPVPNRYAIFPGDLRHGVKPQKEFESDVNDPAAFRLSLLINYWGQRPSAPLGREYDGSIYKSFARPVERG